MHSISLIEWLIFLIFSSNLITMYILSLNFAFWKNFHVDSYYTWILQHRHFFKCDVNTITGWLSCNVELPPILTHNELFKCCCFFRIKIYMLNFFFLEKYNSIHSVDICFFLRYNKISLRIKIFTNNFSNLTGLYVVIFNYSRSCIIMQIHVFKNSKIHYHKLNGKKIICI